MIPMSDDDVAAVTESMVRNKQCSGRTQMDRLIRFFKAEEGATAGEYALIVSLIAVAIIVGAMAVGTSINSKISNVASSIAASGS
jgi:pilus assembly protein Flp/PilA